MKTNSEKSAKKADKKLTLRKEAYRDLAAKKGVDVKGGGGRRGGSGGGGGQPGDYIG